MPLQLTESGRKAVGELGDSEREVQAKSLLQNAPSFESINDLTEAVAKPLGVEPDNLEELARSLLQNGFIGPSDTEDEDEGVLVGQETATMSEDAYAGRLTPITQETSYTGKVKDCSRCHGPVTDIASAVSDSDMCISCMGDDWKGLEASLKQGDISLSGGDVQEGSITLPPGSLTL